jgi:hypothetical protein
MDNCHIEKNSYTQMYSTQLQKNTNNNELNYKNMNSLSVNFFCFFYLLNFSLLFYLLNIQKFRK